MDYKIPASWSEATFWFSAIGAAIMRVMISPKLPLIQSIITVFAALFCAMVFTDPVLHWLALERTTYSTAVTALVALTGDHAARWLLGTISDPSRIIDLINRLRGRGA